MFYELLADGFGGVLGFGMFACGGDEDGRACGDSAVNGVGVKGQLPAFNETGSESADADAATADHDLALLGIVAGRVVGFWGFSCDDRRFRGRGRGFFGPGRQGVK